MLARANFISRDRRLLNKKLRQTGMDTDARRIATQRVQTLFKLASEAISEDPTLAQRYASLARKIAMAAKLRLSKEYRRQICRHCKSFILPGVNCRVRIKQLREPHAVITCLICGGQMRIPLRKKENQRKREPAPEKPRRPSLRR